MTLLRSRKKILNTSAARRRLRLILAVFFFTLSVPIYLLLDKVYYQLENEVNFNLRNQAEVLFERIEHRMQESIAAEENRPVAEYSFFNLLESPLLESAGVKLSPLSEIPPNSEVPGITGYFQITPEGAFTIPGLPEINTSNRSVFSAIELEKRSALKNKLKNMLMAAKQDENALIQSQQKNESLNPQKAKKDAPSAPTEDPRLDQKFQLADADIQTRTRNPDNDRDNSAEPESSYHQSTEILSPQKLKELNLDAKRWKQNRTENETRESYQRLEKSIQPYRSRKEIVKLPDQSLAGAMLSRQQSSISSPYSDEITEEELKNTASKKSNDAYELNNSPSPFNVLGVESEVGPLQFIMLEAPYFCFFRRAWHLNERYIQGFIVNGPDFLAHAVNPVLSSTGSEVFSSLLIANNGLLVQRFTTAVPDTHESLLYRAFLQSPFQHLELIIYAGPIPTDPGRSVVDILSISLAIVLSIGLLIFYRLGMNQIELTRLQRNFISAVSHELKTPLTSIRMYSEMLRANWVSDTSKKQSYYDYIFLESERLSRLISNILELTRMDNLKNTAKLKSHDPSQLLLEIKRKVLAQVESAGFELEIIPSTTKLTGHSIQVDEDAFFQIMINVVDNAIKFSADSINKTIHIGIRENRRTRKITFFVRDFGPGVDKKQMKKIFRLFYRPGDELTRNRPGTGIGLALVAQLAETMNAKIDIINRQPGLEFQIVFILKNETK